MYALLAEVPDDRPTGPADVYDILAAHAGPPPPMPGVIAEGLHPVRAYAAAIAGRPPVGITGEPAVRAAADPQQLAAKGEFRAAARLWRQLAARHREEHGPAHPLVVDCMVQAARAHVSLGEPDRARRMLSELLRSADAEAPVAHQIREELERLGPTADR